MQEIKCPKCGEVFQVDETGYAAIVKRHCKTGKGRGIPQGNSRTPGTV